MKQMILWALLISFVLPLAGCNPGKTAEFVTIKSYEDIPGITPEEIAAIEALKATRKSFSYGHVDGTEAFMLPDGTYEGFTYKLCGLLTELFGIEFAPTTYETWGDLKSALDRKEIDFNGDLTFTPERFKLYYMSHAIAERSLRLFTRKNSDYITTEADISGLNIGCLPNTITAETIMKTYHISFNTVDVEGYSDAARMLRSGDIDAFVLEAVSDPAFEDYDFIVSKEFFPMVYNPVSMATADPELAPIISAVNKYLIAGGVDRLHELYREGDFEYVKYKLDKSFTEEERAYLDNLISRGAGISLALEHDNYPVCFYNEKEGEFQGISIDVLEEISRLINVEFEVATTKDTTWAEILEKLRLGEVSMVSQLLYSDARKDNFIWSSVPYASSYYALISKSDYPSIALYQVIRAKVGNINKTAFEDMYIKWFPDSSNSISYETQNTGLDALEEGEIDLLMASDYILLTQLNYREKPGYKINVRFNQPMDSLFGFNKDEEILCSIIDKTQAYVKTSTIASDWESRVFDYSKKLANQRVRYLLVFIFVLLAVLLATIVLLLKNQRLSKDLERQTGEAKVASKAKSTFLASMSHEIRTPLNAIIGMSGIAKNSIEDKDKAIASIDQIISSSNHLLGVLNDVLDMSKIESGRLELACEPFSLLEAYREISVIIMQRCREKNISFVTNIGEQRDTTLIGDKLRVNQVLINLLGNAVKFTDAEGEITLTVNVLRETDEDILLGFSVLDNGIGMSDEQVARLFVPFEQTDRSITARFGGTGLGLSISQNLVNMMGSVIKVESRLGKGSRFYFELRFEKGNMEMRETEVPDSVDLTGKKILLVEDIDINRLIICENLSFTGVEIDEAEDGLQAIEMLEGSPVWYYDLIFMDVQMPVMDGYEATRQIRAMERDDAKHIPIVAMTANAYKEDVDEALAAGMNEHLSKPVNTDILMKLLVHFMINTGGKRH